MGMNRQRFSKTVVFESVAPFLPESHLKLLFCLRLDEILNEVVFDRADLCEAIVLTVFTEYYCILVFFRIAVVVGAITEF